MPTRMTSRFAISELVDATLANPFSFSKGVPLLKLKPRTNDAGEALEVQGMTFEDTATRLYDLQSDPRQEIPIQDEKTEDRLATVMTALMQEADAPSELFKRLDLEMEAADV